MGTCLKLGLRGQFHEHKLGGKIPPGKICPKVGGKEKFHLGSISWAQVRMKFCPNLGGIFPPGGKLISWTFFGRKFISVEMKFCPNFYSSQTLQNLFPPRWISTIIIKDTATNIQKRECTV